MTANHFTAWLVNDPSCLETDACDIIILQDEAVSYDVDAEGNETPNWASNGPQVFYAVTTVSARDGDIADAIREADDLMEAAGWRIVGDWDAVDNAYIVTVERA
jgi:hypothetical protein